MSLKRFPPPLDGADAVYVGRFDWVPWGVPVPTSDQIWLHISPGLDVALGEFSGPLSNCGLVCNKTAIFFSLCFWVEWLFFVASEVHFLSFLFLLDNFDTGAFSGNFLVAIASWLFVASQPRGLHDFPFSARGRWPAVLCGTFFMVRVCISKKP